MRKALVILGWAWVTALAFCYGSTLAVYYTLAHPSTSCPSNKALTLAFYVLFAVFLTIAIVADFACRRKRWDVSSHLRYWALAFCYGSTLAVYYILTHSSTSRPSGNELTVASCGLFALFLTIAIVADFACRRKGWDASCRLRYGALALLTLPLLLLLLDARPLEHEYTEADVRSHDPAVLASYEPFMKTFGRRADNPPVQIAFSKLPSQAKVGLYTGSETNPQAYAEVINKSWEEIAGVRKALAELDQFPGITDIGASTRMDFTSSVPCFITIRNASRVYRVYASLKAAEGDTLEAARQLSLLQRIARKSLPHSGILVTRMIWVAVANGNIMAAGRLLESPKCDAATLAVLKENFPPIPVADLSLRKVFMTENISAQNILRQYQAKGAAEFIMGLCGEKWEPDAAQFSWVRRLAALPPYWFLYRPKLTFRELRRVCDLAIRGDECFPARYKDYDLIADELYQAKTCHNFFGRKIVALSMPSQSKASQKVTDVKIRSDLLSLELCKRLGEPRPALADPYTKAAYAADAQGHFFSPGPDGQPGTADDITLEEKIPPPPPPPAR